MWYFVSLSLEISIKLLFFSFLFPSFYRSVNFYVVCAVSGRCNKSFFALFLCSFWVVVLLHPHYLQCSRVFFLLFLTSIRSKDFASSLAFLSSGPFTEVLSLSTSRMVPDILQEGEPKCLSLLLSFHSRDTEQFLAKISKNKFTTNIV